MNWFKLLIVLFALLFFVLAGMGLHSATRGSNRRVRLGDVLQLQLVDDNGTAQVSCPARLLLVGGHTLFVQCERRGMPALHVQAITYRTNRFTRRPDANQRAMQIRGRGNTYEHQFSLPLPVLKARPGGYILQGGKYHVPRLPWGALGMIYG